MENIRLNDYIGKLIESNGIEKIPMFNATFNDKPYILQSIISPDRKKSLLCYVRNNDNTDKYGYCAIYNVNENKFFWLGH